MAASFDASGGLPNLLGGSEVRFDGIPAPIFYTQAGQINVQAPYTIAGQQATRVEVLFQAKSAARSDLGVVEAAPALFPLALNQDAGSNSAAAPAPRGTIVTLFATGEGLTDGPNVCRAGASRPVPASQAPGEADDRRNPGRDPLRRKRSGAGGNAADQRPCSGRIPGPRPGSGGVAGRRGGLAERDDLDPLGCYSGTECRLSP